MIGINRENLSLIFDDNPISRAYINILINFNFTKINLFELTDNYLFLKKVNRKINFINKNLKAINLIKNKNLTNFLFEVEEYFEFERGFINKMYKSENINHFENIITINNRNVNSPELKEQILSFGKEITLNTSRKIFKDILDTNKLFLHIHHGYLPDIRGADGSLNSLDKKKEIGSSAFFINRKIDEGDIILRKKFKLPKFKHLKLELFNDSELYNIWYSFFDPLLRAKILKELILIKNFKITKQETEIGNYYSFIEKKNIKKILINVIDKSET